MRLIYVIPFLVVTFAAILPASASVEEAVDFTRYQVILSRMPFGNTTAAATAAAAPANPNLPALSSVLRLVALEKDDETGALQAGIVDGPGKKNHYLRVGDEEDGVKLVDADYAGDRALVRKGEQEEWLVMASGSKASSAGAAPNAATDLLARRNAFREMQNRRLSGPPGSPQPQPPPGIVIATNAPRFMNPMIRNQVQKPPPPIPTQPEDDESVEEATPPEGE